MTPRNSNSHLSKTTGLDASTRVWIESNFCITEGFNYSSNVVFKKCFNFWRVLLQRCRQTPAHPSWKLHFWMHRPWSEVTMFFRLLLEWTFSFFALSIWSLIDRDRRRSTQFSFSVKPQTQFLLELPIFCSKSGLLVKVVRMFDKSFCLIDRK